MEETWIHHYKPKTIKQTKQWTGRGKPTPKKTKNVAFAGNMMASLFWDAKGILLIDYPEKEKTITGKCYAFLLDRSKTAIAKKRPGMAKKKVLFHHNNASVHSSHVDRQK